MRYRLYTDGSSHAKSQLPGGWAWLFVRIDGDGFREPLTVKPLHCCTGGAPVTSNNIMELTAMLQGLGAIASDGWVQAGDDLEVVSDSQYALNMAIGNWNATSNRDLINCLQREVERLENGGIRLKFSWTPGHAGEPWNERVDALATKAKKKVVDALLAASIAESRYSAKAKSVDLTPETNDATLGLPVKHGGRQNEK